MNDGISNSRAYVQYNVNDGPADQPYGAMLPRNRLPMLSPA